jgi:periplasmic protein CpxP/Spy
MRRQFLPMIMILAVALIFVSLTAISYAQPGGEGGGKGPGPGPGPKGPMPGNMIDMRMKMLTENLELNKDQAAKIKAILEEEQKAAAVEREKNQGDREAAMKSREARREATDTKVRAVLSKDQIVKYDKMMAEFRKNRPGGPGQEAPKADTKAVPGDTKPVAPSESK